MAKGTGKKRAKKAAGAASDPRARAARLEKALAASLKREAKAASRLEAAQHRGRGPPDCARGGGRRRGDGASSRSHPRGGDAVRAEADAARSRRHASRGRREDAGAKAPSRPRRAAAAAAKPAPAKPAAATPAAAKPRPPRSPPPRSRQPRSPPPSRRIRRPVPGAPGAPGRAPEHPTAERRRRGTGLRRRRRRRRTRFTSWSPRSTDTSSSRSSTSRSSSGWATPWTPTGRSRERCREELVAVLVRLRGPRPGRSAPAGSPSSAPSRSVARQTRARSSWPSRLSTGVPLHVLDHEEEGLLNLLGATAGRPIEASLAVVDIGGGSIEVVVVGAGDPRALGRPSGRVRDADSGASWPMTRRPPRRSPLLRAEARLAVRRCPAWRSRDDARGRRHVLEPREGRARPPGAIGP